MPLFRQPVRNLEQLYSKIKRHGLIRTASQEIETALSWRLEPSPPVFHSKTLDRKKPAVLWPPALRGEIPSVYGGKIFRCIAGLVWRHAAHVQEFCLNFCISADSQPRSMALDTRIMQPGTKHPRPAQPSRALATRTPTSRALATKTHTKRAHSPQHIQLRIVQLEPIGACNLNLVR